MIQVWAKVCAMWRQYHIANCGLSSRAATQMHRSHKCEKVQLGVAKMLQESQEPHEGHVDPYYHLSVKLRPNPSR